MTMDFEKPIFLRPNEKDVAVLELIAKAHPVLSSPADLIRHALECYLSVYGNGSGWEQTIEGIRQQQDRMDQEIEKLKAAVGLS